MRLRNLNGMVLVVALVVLALGTAAQANVFDMGGTRNADGTWTGLASLETVPVGNLHNTGEWSGEIVGGYGRSRICGAVGYAYNIGKYEVTAGQYAEFLNAVAKSDPYGLYNTGMYMHDNYKIQRSSESGDYRYSVAADWANRPVNYVSWGDAARFANWLHNGQGSGDTEDGAYNLSGTHQYYNPDGSINDYSGLYAALMAVNREADWKWAIPTEDEWYKAAFHKNDGDTGNYFDYPTSNDGEPSNDLTDPDPGNNATFSQYDTIGSTNTIGSPYWTTEVGDFEESESPYGTFDQGGNLWEWNESEVYYTRSLRGVRGGCWGNDSYQLAASSRGSSDPTNENGDGGFRVANVPEPGSLAMLVGIALMSLVYWRRRHA